MRRLGKLMLGVALWCGGVTFVGPSLCGATSYHVDSQRGNDKNQGTEAEPWKTLGKANAVVPALQAGDSLLFRRGCQWEGESLKIHGVKATEASPLVVGAYGPKNEPRPSISKGRIAIFTSEHVILRSMEIHHNPGGPCIAVSESSYLTVVDNWVHHSRSNGIAYHAFVHHTVTADNIVHDVLANDGISIHDAQAGPVGSHHWVIDNLLPGKYYEDAIDVASEDKENGPAAQDIKIIGNRIFGARLCGVVSQHQCRYTWVLGNTLIGCGHGGAKALSLGKEGADGDGWVKASGNLLVNNPRGIRLRDQADFRNNTIIHPGGGPILFINHNADHMILKQNLILSGGTTYLQVSDKLSDMRLLSLDRNWYGPIHPGQATPEKPLRYQGAPTLADWQNRHGLDKNSAFASTALLQLDVPPITDVAKWDKKFLSQFIPDKKWKGHRHQGGVGAFGRGGKRLGMKITPFAKLKLNDGYGWAGNKLVRERYPMTNDKK